VLVTFGIWGVLTFLWFLIAGVRALYLNYAYGDPQFKRINTYLLCAFLTKIIAYFFVFGSFYSDLVGFTGLLGMSVCINNGLRQPVPVRAENRWPARRPIRVPQPQLASPTHG
jgi:hypothetical protein